jgi:hypothetical protein
MNEFTEFTITEICKSTWYAGMLQDCFKCGDIAGSCNSILYRAKMHSANISLNGAGFRRGFALASMPVDWSPRVGDVIKVHRTQM